MANRLQLLVLCFLAFAAIASAFPASDPFKDPWMKDDQVKDPKDSNYDKPKCGTGEKLVHGVCVKDEPQCGKDEVLQDGKCVPCPPTCAKDEKLENGKCVKIPPTCARDEKLEYGKCVKIPPTCGSNEKLQNGTCVPVCGSDEKLEHGKCVPACAYDEKLQNGTCFPICSNDEKLENGTCVKVVPECAENEVLQDNKCVPCTLQCASDEKLVHGVCVKTGCASGEKLVHGVCVKVEVKACKEGEELVLGVCVPTWTHNPYHSCDPLDAWGVCAHFVQKNNFYKGPWKWAPEADYHSFCCIQVRKEYSPDCLCKAATAKYEHYEIDLDRAMMLPKWCKKTIPAGTKCNGKDMLGYELEEEKNNHGYGDENKQEQPKAEPPLPMEEHKQEEKPEDRTTYGGYYNGGY